MGHAQQFIDNAPAVAYLLTQAVPELTDLQTSRLVTLFWLAVAVSIVAPRVPFGRQIMYPFALLSTWVHEMGHGLAAIAVGGRFRRLEIYPNLGGQAMSTGVYGVGRAIVSAGGLLGPALAGGAIIVSGSRDQTAQWVLTVVAVAVAVSLLAFVRNLYGWLSLGAIAVVLIPTALYAPLEVRIFLAQLIGIQFCLACWGSLDYMFTKQFHRDGRVLNSDTQEIANVLLLPYWFWGALIATVSLGVVVAAFYFAWVLPAST